MKDGGGVTVSPPEGAGRTVRKDAPRGHKGLEVQLTWRIPKSEHFPHSDVLELRPHNVIAFSPRHLPSQVAIRARGTRDFEPFLKLDS